MAPLFYFSLLSLNERKSNQSFLWTIYIYMEILCSGPRLECFRDSTRFKVRSTVVGKTLKFCASLRANIEICPII